MSLIQNSAPLGRPRDAREAAQSLEAVLLRQMLAATGAFHGSDAPGSQIHSDLFIDALADAVARAGGMGLADVIARQLDPHANGGVHPGPARGALPDTRASTTFSRTGAIPPRPDAPTISTADAPELLTGLAAPAHGRVTSRFGHRTDPIDGHDAFHRGVDIAATGGAPIRAAREGVVVSAGHRGGYGLSVEVDHGGGLTTLYAHAESLDVRPGDRVEAGQPLGRVGHTGRATGDHLHFELRQDGRPVDPARALKAYGARADSPPDQTSDV